jgi:hypothetical protein
MLDSQTASTSAHRMPSTVIADKEKNLTLITGMDSLGFLLNYRLCEFDKIRFVTVNEPFFTTFLSLYFEFRGI